MVNYGCNKTSNNRRLFISCFFITAGGGILLSWIYIFNGFLRFCLTLQENSYLDELWRVNPVPLYFNTYMFNWTNPEDLYKPGVKPRFQEVGPFTYREIKEKKDVTFNENNTVTFKQYHTFFYDRNRSVSDLDVPITTINPILTTAVYKANRNNWGFFKQAGMQIAFSQLKQDVVVTKNAGQHLFEGYPDNLVKLITAIPHPMIPDLPMNGRFFWFVGRNASSSEGTFNMGTDYDNFGVLKNWNFANRTSHYKNSCDNLINMSAGELHRPYPGDTIMLYIADMCRAIPLEFQEEEDVNGVLGRKYTMGRRFLDNGTLYPQDQCFSPGERLPSGVANISICNYGAPGFISLPHFLGADQYYLNNVEGMEPDESKHEFFITLEPSTGVPLRVAGRLQLSFLLEPAKYIRLFKNVPRLNFPILWIEEVAELPEDLLLMLKIVLFIPTVLKTIGMTTLVFGVYWLIRNLYQRLVSSFPQKSKHKLIIRELVPLNLPETKLQMVFETDVQLLGKIYRK